jgi:hypothetical protein
MSTLVCIRHCEIDGHRYSHGEEVPPDALPRETVNQWLDRKWLLEYDSSSVRRSLYRLFSAFSGTKEHEDLSKEERLTLFASTS